MPGDHNAMNKHGVVLDTPVPGACNGLFFGGAPREAPLMAFVILGTTAVGRAEHPFPDIGNARMERTTCILTLT